MMWCRDFNQHHLMWDEECNSHLFAVASAASAELLISLLADFDMSMLLLKGIPTLQSMATKNWIRVDNIFASK